MANTDQRVYELIQGYSEINSDNSVFYFKHPSILDSLKIDSCKKAIQKRGRSLGILTEEQLIEKAIESNRYSKEKEDERNDLKWAIDKKRQLTSKLNDKNLIKSNEENIKLDKKRLEEIEEERNLIISSSLEEYTSKKLFYKSFEESCFYDASFSENIKRDDLSKYLSYYINCLCYFRNLDNIVYMSYSPIFFELYSISNDPLFIYGKKAADITVFQKDTILCAKVLRSKLDHLDNIPKNVRNDALKLYHYSPKDSSPKETEETDIRSLVSSKGGLKNMKPQDKIT